MTISAKPPVYDLSVETIYLDSLFALNAIIDYLLLLCSARAAGAVVCCGRRPVCGRRESKRRAPRPVPVLGLGSKDGGARRHGPTHKLTSW